METPVTIETADRLRTIPESVPSALSAGGTVAHSTPTMRRRLFLCLEMAVLYAAMPLAVMWAVKDERVPLFIALLPFLVLIGGILLCDRTFSLRAEMRRGFDAATFMSIVLVFIFAGGTLTAWVADTHPRQFLEFPNRAPDTWSRIMLLYPLASVAVQELVYRTFFFHRYGPLFGNQRVVAVVLNGALFGFGHIVIGTWFAIIGTCITGTLFAVRYAVTRSYWAVFIEHTLWGWLVFTVGLGHYFFTGVPNVP